MRKKATKKKIKVWKRGEWPGVRANLLAQVLESLPTDSLEGWESLDIINSFCWVYRKYEKIPCGKTITGLYEEGCFRVLYNHATKRAFLKISLPQTDIKDMCFDNLTPSMTNEVLGICTQLRALTASQGVKSLVCLEEALSVLTKKRRK